MSKTVPIYGWSSRRCSPACPLLCGPRCLTASRMAPPVHGVSTTRATTAKLPSAPAGQPGSRSGAPHPHSVPRHTRSAHLAVRHHCREIANVCPAALPIPAVCHGGKGSSARGHIPPVQVRLVGDEIGGEPSDAGSNEAFRAAYRRGSTSPDCEADTLYQRFRRARDDVKALLQLPPSAELT
jgi:hypothetical protein